MPFRHDVVLGVLLSLGVLAASRAPSTGRRTRS
jgi:hypothetical protein